MCTSLSSSEEGREEKAIKIILEDFELVTRWLTSARMYLAAPWKPIEAPSGGKGDGLVLCLLKGLIIKEAERLDCQINL